MSPIAHSVSTGTSGYVSLFTRLIASASAFVAIAVCAQVPFTLISPVSASAYGGVAAHVGAVRIRQGVQAKALSVEINSGRVTISYVAEGLPLQTADSYIFGADSVTLVPGAYVLRIVERAPGEPDRVSQDFPFTVPAATPPVKARSLYNRSSEKFFITASQADYDALVNSSAILAASRWVPVDGGFNVWTTPADAPTAARPVCRFFSPAAGTHFFSVDSRDCVTLAVTPGFVDEGIAFYALPPLNDDGLGSPMQFRWQSIEICPSGTEPVYRMFNRTPGMSAHRYTTNPDAVRQAINAVPDVVGWVKESIAFCNPLLR